MTARDSMRDGAKAHDAGERRPAYDDDMYSPQTWRQRGWDRAHYENCECDDMTEARLNLHLAARDYALRGNPDLRKAFLSTALEYGRLASFADFELGFAVELGEEKSLRELQQSAEDAAAHPSDKDKRLVVEHYARVYFAAAEVVVEDALSEQGD